jgi:parallel beta-helix repeat protein
LGLAVLVAGRLGAQTVKPYAGMVITHSVRLTPGTWHLTPSASLDSGVITVRGDSVTVDARGVTLLGASDTTLPDEYRGVAIRIEGGHGVRILGLRIHGYRFGVRATGTQALTLDGLDVSRSWKPRLFSLVEHESLVDWLSFHHNEHGEWLRYGAGIYLESVDSGDIEHVTGEGGMNGLMLVRSTHLRIWDNDFSFNSGLGIGLYRSSDNNIQHNRLDYDVRGYSKFYHRGQDSAGLLLFEQSSRNIIAWNSVTHGGDGLFLWAGQSTMDSGEGGCNDNLIYGNDFSYAPANGIEVTFSRNTIVGNTMSGNDYGIWGGYSYDTKIVGNTFRQNRTGIAIEHGQENLIGWNTFHGDTTGLRLWADTIAPSDWGYPKHRDTRSRDVQVLSNVFENVETALKVTNTDSLRNESESPMPSEYSRLAPRPLDGTRVPSTSLSRRDRLAIVMTEWGPYDYRAPLKQVATFAPAISWDAKFFVWSDSTDPRSKPDAFKRILAGTPILTRQESRLDYEWYGPAIKALPLEKWALDATGSVELGPGTYSIRTISDDAVRVWVDGKLAIDDWVPHESVVDHAAITGGRHQLQVQYYQVDGWTELRLEIVRGVETSTGSPGPH